ncbi:MAG: chemotaxis protein CheW [Clostridiaceae bacterium]|nr:chemotaxis protein CheW [Clostridiaceae bacterium]
MGINLIEEPLNEESEGDTLSGLYLTFMLGEEYYGLPVTCVTEIIGMQVVTTIPDRPEYLRGVFNLRGKIIPVLDVRLRFNKPVVEYNDRTCIIVLNLEDIAAGLIVDQVAEVVHLDATDIEPVPEGRGGYSNPFISGLGKVGQSVKMLIDCYKILNKTETEPSASGITGKRLAPINQ